MDRNTKKSNDNNLTKAIIFILLISMIAMILVSGTYAKYTSSASGTATATVAKWAFNVNDTDLLGNNGLFYVINNNNDVILNLLISYNINCNFQNKAFRQIPNTRFFYPPYLPK